jgi:hypothetical protein
MSRLLIIGIGLMLTIKVAAQTMPQLAFTNNKVVVKDLDKEVLYTFCRYYNSPEAWREVFPVTTAEARETSIDGIYEVAETSVSFSPRYPFSAKVAYQATFHLEALSKNYNEIYLPEMSDKKLTLGFSPAEATYGTPEVSAIFPSGNILPENLLKFHISFTSSMTLGEVYKRVKLLDHSGKEVSRPFLLLDQELWDVDMKTVTLLLDPGRIKRGLRPNMEMGTALKRNETYTLVVESGWKDQYGLQTETTTRKTFVSAPADRTKLSITTWDLTPPGTADGVVVLNVGENLERILFSDAVRIINGLGHTVRGKIILDEHESMLVFHPEQPWKDDTYTIHVNPLLEDLAGNNLNRLFDEDANAKYEEPVTTLSFTVNLLNH